MRVCFICIMSLYVVFNVTAQHRSGTIVDGRNEPVAFATVVLLKDGVQTRSAITDTLGQFSLSAEAGCYHMKIHRFTYKPGDLEIKITEAEDLGVFKVAEEMNGLKEVMITASAIRRESDRFVMQVNNIPEFINKDATEVLQLAPGVWIDDNGISINGASGTKVFINHRELKLTSKELTDYLRNYHSSDIARVEVIPQSGAEYSADAKGGIVRILLRKRLENGISGNAILKTTQGLEYQQYHPFVRIDVQTRKWIWSISFTGDVAPRKKNKMGEVRYFEDETLNMFRSHATIDSKPFSEVGKIGALFTIDPRNSIEAEVEYKSLQNNARSYGETSNTDAWGTAHSVNCYDQRERDSGFSGMLNYVHRMDTAGSVYRFAIDYTGKRNTGDNLYQTEYQMSVTPIDSIYANHSRYDYGIFTADAVMEKQLRRGTRISAGIRYVRNNVDTRSQYEGSYQSVWRPIDAYNYILYYKENIGAGYLTLAKNLQCVKVLAGVRAEYTRVSGKSTFRKHYFDLFPNLNITYFFNTMQTFMLIGEYGKHIQRPNFWHLNSSRIQYSDYSYMIGNPLLRPTYIHKMSLTLVWNYRYTFTVGANLHKDLIREITETDAYDPRTKYVIPENHHMENHYFAAVSCPLRVNKQLSIKTNLIGVKQDIRGMKADVSKSHYLYFINATANLILPAEFYFDLTFSGTSRLYSANSGIEPSHLIHANLKKKFLNNHMNIAFGVRNLFNNKASYFAYMDGYKSISDVMNAKHMRTFVMSLQYNFNSGKSVKKRQTRSLLETEKARIDRSTEMK